MAGPMPGAPAPEGGGGGGDVQSLVGNVMKGLGIVAELMEKSGAPDEVKGEMADVMSRFEGLVAPLMGGGGEAPAPAGPQGPKAVPIQESQGKPVGPQG